jgi:hypothetical protein
VLGWIAPRPTPPPIPPDPWDAEGDFFEEERHGHGRQVLPDGSVYVGYWEHDERCGVGRMDYCQGHASGIVFYEGEVM